MSTRAADEVIVVTGLPRSGTSMLMQMLAAGGMPVIVDDHRLADEDNPFGYFEYQPVKSIETDISWLDAAKGRAVKVVVPLLQRLPLDRAYAVLFIHRSLDAVFRSQERMLRRRGGDAGLAEEWIPRLARLEEEGFAWCRAAGTWSCRSCHVQYEEIVADPIKACRSIKFFLERELRLDEMVTAVSSPRHYVD